MGFLYLQFSSFKDLFIEKIMDKYALKFWGKILSKKPPSNSHPAQEPHHYQCFLRFKLKILIDT